MILDTTLRLEAVMAASATTINPDVHVVYADWNPANEETRPGINRASLNHITDVIILAAPINNPTREVRFLSIYNRDTTTNTVTVKTDDGTTERVIFKQALTSGQSLVYAKEAGFQVI